MNPIRWHKPKWLPKMLAMPVPEAKQQAGRILAIQRNIVLPAKLVVIGIVFYYLFYARWLDISSPAQELVQPREVVLQTLQSFFIFYLIFSAIAATLLVLRRFPHRLVPWVVFTSGLMDGLLLAGLTLETGGFASNLFWVFPGMIVVNALSIPLATPQIVLNLSLSVFYLGAGFVNINFGENDLLLPAPPQRSSAARFKEADIQLEPLATRLKQPAPDDRIVQFLNEQWSDPTRELLARYTDGRDPDLQKALTDDLNRIVAGSLLYDPSRFTNISLSRETLELLERSLRPANPPMSNWARVNRALIWDAFPRELPRRQTGFGSQAADATVMVEASSEPFVLRLIILWLMTASCYGVQLLSFRQQLSDEEARKSVARNDELKAAGRLAAEIAHQLKNPLGIINNAAFSLQRGIKEGRNDFELQFEIIREEIERSDRILTQLMGYAQLSEGRVEKLDLSEELERAIAEVFPPGAIYDIQVHRNYEANLPGLLMQRNHFSVVLINLLQNAREALGGEGNISIHARSRSDGSVEIVIADDGPGIASEIQGKVFEAYFTSKEKGTGLGLAIVKHNVELYGGAVRVESALGKGARFIIYFPAKAFVEAAP